MEVLLLIGAVQALFFSLLVFSKKNKNTSDVVLGFWLLTFFINLILPYLAFVYSPTLSFLNKINAYIFSLLGIWLFIYTKTITSKRFCKKWLFHLLTISIVVISFYPHYTYTSQELEEIFVSRQNFSSALLIGPVVNMAVFAFYAVRSLHILKKHNQNIRFEFSYEKNINLKWLKYLVYSLLSLAVIFFALLILIVFEKVDLVEFDMTLYFYLVLFIFGLGFWGFRQGTIFSYNPGIQISNDNEYQKEKPGKNESYEEKFAGNLHNYMLNKKPYLNPQLSLYELASDFGTSSKELSEHLNRFQKTNFYEYINNYRVQEVKARLKGNKQKFTILSIAFDCGFNSKASFNRIFKQTTGFTPSEYVNR